MTVRWATVAWMMWVVLPGCRKGSPGHASPTVSLSRTPDGAAIAGATQVVFTATAQPGVNSVVFEIAGQLLDVPIASGATVSGPVDRTSYQPQAPVF